MEWSNAKMLQLIELYEKRPYLCDKVAACNWTVTAYASLSRDFVAHSRNKIAEKIAGVTSVLQEEKYNIRKHRQRQTDRHIPPVDRMSTYSTSAQRDHNQKVKVHCIAEAGPLLSLKMLCSIGLSLYSVEVSTGYTLPSRSNLHL